jgi:phenylacetate-coenzyme A ligase PaaK-like adenylate-forming protein
MDDTIKVKGVNFWPSAVWTVLEGQSDLIGTHRIIIETREGKDYLKVVAELKEGAKPDTQKLIDTLKSNFQFSLFIKVDEIDLVPFDSLKMSEHKDKTIIDLRKRNLSFSS